MASPTAAVGEWMKDDHNMFVVVVLLMSSLSTNLFVSLNVFSESLA